MSNDYSKKIAEAIELFKTHQKKAQAYISSLFKDSKQPLAGTGKKLGFTFFQGLSDLELPVKKITNNLLVSKKKELRILGLFTLAEYGRKHPKQVFNLFRRFAKDHDAQVRDAAAIAFRRVIENNKKAAILFLRACTLDLNTKVRRFVCETMRPVGENRWLLKQPKKSLSILIMFMRDGSMPVKKSLSTNLAELSRKDPKLIYDFLNIQMKLGNLNTYWTIYRACRELIKLNKYRKLILKLLNIDEYNLDGKLYR